MQPEIASILECNDTAQRSIPAPDADEPPEVVEEFLPGTKCMDEDDGVAGAEALRFDDGARKAVEELVANAPRIKPFEVELPGEELPACTLSSGRSVEPLVEDRAEVFVAFGLNSNGHDAVRSARASEYVGLGGAATSWQRGLVFRQRDQKLEAVQGRFLGSSESTSNFGRESIVARFPARCSCLR